MNSLNVIIFGLTIILGVAIANVSKGLIPGSSVGRSQIQSAMYAEQSHCSTIKDGLAESNGLTAEVE